MKFIIVSYNFPPYGLVGGRRWFLFANELVSLGYDVTVISAIQSKQISPWKEEENKNVEKVFLPSGNPKFIEKINPRLIDKIWSKIFLKYQKVLNKGHPYDKGFFWIRKVKKYLIDSKALDKNTYLVLSGAPFSTLRLSKFGSLMGSKVILDYRDPFTWNNAYGFDSLPPKRRNFETLQQAKAIESAFVILVPNKTMKRELEFEEPKSIGKVNILPHPIDLNFKGIAFEPIKSVKVRLIYAGRLYPECINDYKALVKFIELNKNIELSIYTHLNSLEENLYEIFANKANVKISGQLPPSNLAKKLQRVCAYIIYTPNRMKDYVTTKYPDLVSSQLPLLIKANEGVLTREISKLPQVRVFHNNNELKLILDKIDLLKSDFSANKIFLQEFSGSAKTLIKIIEKDIHINSFS